jgi:Tol biopolymer transport system component
MALSAGDKLGSYEIVSLLGRGGMGEVYRARDPRLGRDIAIKLLPASFADDPARLRRLEREARAAAALNHPNIVTVYSVDNAGSTLFLTMELVDGRSLALVIPKRGFSVDALLKIAIPLTDAVAAAHSKGIVHRDLKPANIMIGAGEHEGRVKVLDFGLATVEESSLPAPVATTMTVEGRVVGTASYMSPEQASGSAVDARSDLFSLGVILYEMATGERPFKGDTTASVLSSILRDTPTSVVELNASIPGELGRIIRHCLVKDPARRYQTAADLRNELTELKQEIESGSPAGRLGNARRAEAPRSWTRIAGAAALVVVALTIGLVTAYRAMPSREAAAGLPGAVERTFTQLTALPGLEEHPSVSADGKWIVYDGDQSGNADIYLQSVGGHNPINLTKDSLDDDTEPALSPDGEWIAFRSDRDGGGLFVMGRTGESVRRLTDHGFSPTWSPDGRQIAYSTSLPDPFNRAPGELWTVDVGTGETHRIVGVLEDGVQPSWSPHGERIAYWTVLSEGRAGRRDILTIPAVGGKPTPVTSDAALDWNPIWSPDGRFLYFSSDRGGSLNLWRVPIDEVTGRVLGAPEAVTTPSPDSRNVSMSADGRVMVYASFAETANIQRVPFDPVTGTVSGTAVTVVGGSRFLSRVAVSPDGRWLAYYSQRGQLDIFIAHSDGTGERHLTNDQAYDRNPTFSRDGQWIAFMSNRSGKNQLWLIKPDGSGLRQVTYAPAGAQGYNHWSPDGSKLMYDVPKTAGTYVFEPFKPWSSQTAQVVDKPLGGGRYFDPYFWSSDGTQLVGSVGAEQDEGKDVGVVLDSPSSGQITTLSATGFPWAASTDGRRLLYTDRGKLFVIDRASKRSVEILSVAPDDFESVELSSDNRTIYFTRAVRQGDIWSMTLK